MQAPRYFRCVNEDTFGLKNVTQGDKVNGIILRANWEDFSTYLDFYMVQALTFGVYYQQVEPSREFGKQNPLYNKYSELQKDLYPEHLREYIKDEKRGNYGLYLPLFERVETFENPTNFETVIDLDDAIQEKDIKLSIRGVIKYFFNLTEDFRKVYIPELEKEGHVYSDGGVLHFDTIYPEESYHLGFRHRGSQGGYLIMQIGWRKRGKNVNFNF